MNKPKSVLAKLWGFVKSVAALALLGWIAWYAYLHFEPVSSGVIDSEQATAFNCRRAYAKRDSDYACIKSDSCTMTSDELADLKSLEAEIDEHCNLPFNPLADAVP